MSKSRENKEEAEKPSVLSQALESMGLRTLTEKEIRNLISHPELLHEGPIESPVESIDPTLVN